MRRLISELFKAKSVISFAVVLEWINDVSSKVSYWARNGGGHLGVTVIATGGGGGDTKNFFEKLIAFGVLQERWRTPKGINFSKKFFVSPPLRTQ